MRKKIYKKQTLLITFLIFILVSSSALGNSVNNKFPEEIIENQNKNLNENLTFDAIADSYTDNSNADENYGGLSYLSVASFIGCFHHSYIKFDISDILNGSTITSANLKLYYLYTDNNHPGCGEIDCYRITESWSEDNITWNNAPSSYSMESDSCNIPVSCQTWLIWNVKIDVQGFVDGNYTNYGWMLSNIYEFGGIAGFSSKECSGEALDPVLEIEFVNNPPNEPCNPDPEDGSLDVDVNLNISWNCDDPDGDPLVYDIYFGTSTYPGKIKSDHDQTSYYIEGLDGLTTYYWYIIAKDPYYQANTGPLWNFTTKYYNYPPVLTNYKDWPEGVNPKKGDLKTEFMFAVHYYDQNGNEPGLKSVNIIDKNDNTHAYGMEGSGSDSFYTLKINGSEIGDYGTYRYYFFFHDGFDNGEAILPEEGYWTFNIGYPPDKPTLEGPSTVGKNVEVTFTAKAIDPENDNVQYFFDWGNGEKSGWVPEYDSVPSGVEFNYKTKFSKIGTYVIKVKARDINGNIGNWSDPLPVKIQRNKNINRPLLAFLQSFQNQFSILRIMLQWLVV